MPNDITELSLFCSTRTPLSDGSSFRFSAIQPSYSGNGPPTTIPGTVNSKVFSHLKHGRDGRATTLCETTFARDINYLFRLTFLICARNRHLVEALHIQRLVLNV